MSRNKFLIQVPVKIEVRSLENGEHVACNETLVTDIIYSDFLFELEHEMQGADHSAHEEEKYRLSAYVRRELLPKESPDSPICKPNTWVEVIIKGDITTWEKEPYLEKSKKPN